MRVLITGGAGFIGANLARHILGQPHISSVRVLDNLSTGSRANINGLDLEFIEGTLLDYPLVTKAVYGVDSIVHLGAIPSVPRSIADPRASHEANTTGTLNVLEAARHHNVGQVIVASSSSVYGSNPRLPKSEFDWTRPMSPYAVSKQATEGYALAYQFSYGLKTLAFRFFNVYGPGQSAGHAYAAVIPKFLEAAMKRESLQINGDGNQSRDFTYVGTLCAVLYDAIIRKVHSLDPVNLAFGTNTTLLKLVDMIEAELGRPLAKSFVAARVGDVKASQADSSRIHELFPDIEPVSLERGLQETVSWFRSQPTRDH